MDACTHDQCMYIIIILHLYDQLICADANFYAGMVTLSPMIVAPVCRIGDPLQLSCIASVEFMQWSIVVVNEHGMEEEITAIRNSIDPSPPPRQRIINSTTFTFTRTSAQGDSPLISALSIDSVNINLNGTVVNCMEANNPMSSTSTTIQIVDTSNGKLSAIPHY